jgi:hypothetical protein
MKTHRNFLLVIAFIMTAMASVAQQPKPSPPRWLSEKGWWVIETNIHTPRKHLIHFYNQDGVEVYKEQLDGIKLNAKRTKTKMQLKQVLEASVIAWEEQHMPRQNEALVMNRLKRK